MPYIREELRPDKDVAIRYLSKRIENEGDLNYVVTRLICRYVMRFGLSYKTLNTVMGVFSCAAKEFYRRVVVPYEKVKKRENGDVPEYQAIELEIEIARKQTT